MDMKEMICHRKSCRSFTGKPVDGEMIEKILSYELVPLYAVDTPTVSGYDYIGSVSL